MMADKGQNGTEEPEWPPAPAHVGATSFEILLPEDLAAWLREKITHGVYRDAREAALLAFQDMRELDRHPEVRRRLFDDTIHALLDDPDPSMPAEQILAELRAQTRDWARPNAPPPRRSRK